jgi:hypothetical protein
MGTAEAAMMEDKKMIDEVLLKKYGSFEEGNKLVKDILQNSIAEISIVE